MKKALRLFTFMCLILTLTACGVSEKDYQAAVSEKEALKTELETAQQENKVLNESVTEIYKERENLLAEIDRLKDENKALAAKKDADQGGTGKSAGKDSYIIQPDDTLGRIADKTGVPLEDLKRLNHITNNDVIWVGQKLRLR